MPRPEQRRESVKIFILEDRDQTEQEENVVAGCENEHV